MAILAGEEWDAGQRNLADLSQETFRQSAYSLR